MNKRIYVTVRQSVLEALRGLFPAAASDAELIRSAASACVAGSAKGAKKQVKSVRSQGLKDNARMVKEAYISAYKKRYSVLENKIPFAAKQNKLVYVLLDQIGFENAVRVARAYPNYPGVYHLQRRHPFELLVSSLNEILVWVEHPERQLDAAALRQQYHEKAKHEQERIENERWKRKFLAEDEEKEISNDKARIS